MFNNYHSILDTCVRSEYQHVQRGLLTGTVSPLDVILQVKFQTLRQRTKTKTHYLFVKRALGINPLSVRI